LYGLGQRVHSLHIGAGGLADKKASSGEAPAHVVGGLHRYIDTPINDALVQDGRDNGIGTAQGLEALHAWKLFGDDGNHLDIGIVLLKALANARDGASRPDPTHKMGHFPTGLLQDLHRRAVIVRLPVTFITVLIGEEIAFWLVFGPT